MGLQPRSQALMGLLHSVHDLYKCMAMYTGSCIVYPDTETHICGSDRNEDECI